MGEQESVSFHFETGMIARMMRLPQDDAPAAAWPALCEISKMIGWVDREGPSEVRQIDFDPDEVDLRKYGITASETAEAISWLESHGIISRVDDSVCTTEGQ